MTANADQQRIAALEATVAELQARLAAIEPKPDSRKFFLEKPLPVDSLKRGPDGSVLVDPNAPSYEERQRARIAAEEAEAADRDAKAREGLPPGYFRDPCGIVRDKQGRTVGKLERELAAVAAVNAGLAAEHHAMLVASGLVEDDR